MYTGCHAELQMERVIQTGSVFDKLTYECEVVEFDQEEECFCLLLKNDALTSISLDAKYECRIMQEEEKISCYGRVRERYQHKKGNIIIFQVENGFYKININ